MALGNRVHGLWIDRAAVGRAATLADEKTGNEEGLQTMNVLLLLAVVGVSDSGYIGW